MEQVSFKKLDPNATIPKYVHKGDSGFDLHASVRWNIYPGSIALISTGLAINLPKGTELQVRSRSGLALKKGVFVLNSPGTIDNCYKGEIGIILCNLGKQVFVVEAGDRIAQGVIQKVDQYEITETTVLGESERGANGFGSTGV